MSRSRPRARLVIVPLLLLLAGCPAKTPSTRYGSSSLLPSTSGSPSASPAPSGSYDPEPGGRPQPSDPTRKADPRYPDAGAVGAMAKAYLRSSPADRFVLEIDYIKGSAPTASTISHVEKILKRETEKSSVGVRLDDEIPQSRSTYRIADIEAIERTWRDRHSQDDRATMYMVFLNGDLSGETGTLGVAYRASSAAIFEERIRSAATTLVQPGGIERAVVTHEIGHLLALVNLGYKSAYDHEDAQNPGHSKYRDSVMYWAVEDVSVAALLTGGPPADFDQFDRADLKMLRG